MIVKSPTGLSASLDIAFNQVAVDYSSLISVTLDAAEGLHDFATVELAGIPTRAITDYVGANVSIRVDTGASYVHEFFGSVEAVLPMAKTTDGLLNGSPFQSARIKCVGASYRMRGKRTHVWEGYTLGQMVETLAERHGFSANVPNTPLVFPRFVQQEKSDWAAIVQYAEDHGFRVNAHGSLIDVYDPRKAVNRNRSLHKLTSITGANPATARPYPGQILELEGRFGEFSSDGVYKNASVTVLQEDGTTYDLSTSEVLHGETYAGSVPSDLQSGADTWAEAATILKAEALLEYDYHADVQVLGMAGCYPGGIVDMSTYKSGFDGLWYVCSVKHTIHTNAFLTDLHICRNIRNNLEALPVTPYREPAPTVLRGGDWIPSTRKYTEYA